MCRAGVKYDFIEKPIALTHPELDEFESHLPTCDAVIQVGRHLRSEPSDIDAKQRIDDGCLGKIISYRSENRDYYYDPDFCRRFSPDRGGNNCGHWKPRLRHVAMTDRLRAHEHIRAYV